MYTDPCNLWGKVSECVGLMSHSTHNRSFRRRVFPGNQLHWYWQPKTIKHNTTYTRNTKEKQKKTALTNKTIYTLIWYAFYDLRSGNRVGPILTAPEPTRGSMRKVEAVYICSSAALKCLQTLRVKWFQCLFSMHINSGSVRCHSCNAFV